MKKKLEEILLSWPNFYINSSEVKSLLKKRSEEIHVIISRTVEKKLLTRIKNGLYLINEPYRKKEIDKFELAQNIYDPSYISLESALSYHNWIPEAVYATTSVTTKRTKHFNTPLGNFRFYHIPPEHFLMNVERVETDSSIFLIAEPWKAFADYIDVHQKNWKSFNEVTEDVRIEKETALDNNLSSLNQLSKVYPRTHTRKILLNLYQELKNEK